MKHLLGSSTFEKPCTMYHGVSCAGYLGHPFRKSTFCTRWNRPPCRSMSDASTMNEVHSARTRLPTRLFSRRRGSICAACVHLNQAMPMFQLSRALRTFFSLDQNTDDLPFARHNRRSHQRQIRVACGKRPVTATVDHLASTDQTPCLSENRPVSLGGSR